MTSGTKSRWFSHAMTVGFIVAMLAVCVGLLTRSDGLAFADVAEPAEIASTAD